MSSLPTSPGHLQDLLGTVAAAALVPGAPWYHLNDYGPSLMVLAAVNCWGLATLLSGQPSMRAPHGYSPSALASLELLAQQVRAAVMTGGALAIANETHLCALDAPDLLEVARWRILSAAEHLAVAIVDDRCGRAERFEHNAVMSLSYLQAAFVARAAALQRTRDLVTPSDLSAYVHNARCALAKAESDFQSARRQQSNSLS